MQINKFLLEGESTTLKSNYLVVWFGLVFRGKKCYFFEKFGVCATWMNLRSVILTNGVEIRDELKTNYELDQKSKFRYYL